jgi:hypothetical protein
MRILFFFSAFLFAQFSVAQVKFMERYEQVAQPFESIFEMMRIPGGLVSFRTYQAKNLTSARVFQYHITDQNLLSKGLIEVQIRNGFDLVGYDTDGLNLYGLFSRGFNTGAEKYILEINLETNQGIEYEAGNLLPLELVEFVVIDRKAVFMGNAEGRPALQILNLADKSVHTVQGIYGNNTQVLQIRKLKELEALEVVVSRRGQYKNRETSVLTFDLQGNLVREVKIDKFADQGQEILEGLLLADKNYQQVMIGGFGTSLRNSYQGMYILEINEFGEYETKLYTLEDFPNFYNYLSPSRKAKQDQVVAKELEKGKIPIIRNSYSIRDVRETDDAYYIFFDQINITTSRGSGRVAPPWQNSPYRYDRNSRMGYAPFYLDPFLGPTMTQPLYSVYTEYRYQSAHFIKVAKTGQVLWDNSATYADLITAYPEPFAEIAVVGEDLFHLYAADDDLVLSFFRNGEKIAENLSFELQLPNESERIQFTDTESLRLVHWYDRYFLLTGMQSVKYQNAQGQAEVKDVFFMSKILVDGDLYDPEGATEKMGVTKTEEVTDKKVPVYHLYDFR